MKPTRRGFIKTIAVGILGNTIVSGIPFGVLAKPKFDEGIEVQPGYKVFNLETQKSMEALADNLLPGVKSIGIRRIFMDYISKDPGRAVFYDSGFWNLDSICKAKYKNPFYKLTDKDAQNAAINHIRTHNKLFFNGFRNLVIKFYYSNPTVWRKLSYSGPPQPKGYMDYSLPPKV
jgi:hypothetical protein